MPSCRSIRVGALLAAWCIAAFEKPAFSQPREFPMASSAPSPGQPALELRNRLAEETSPYLLQHKDNPVAWFAWGPEAFEAARTLDRPIFMSIGYSTCYWCHVMERESFENEEIAALMNEHFVCIKVDREERPDVDDIYMNAVQLLTHHGGWPMSVWLDPHTLRPFLGGTYFPPEDRPGHPGFPTVIEHVASLWADRRPEVLRQAQAVASAVEAELAGRRTPVDLGPADVEQAVSSLLASHDPFDGGFTGGGRAPKFPIPATLDFLIGAAWDNPSVRRAVLLTLDRMAIGGMYDQIGGGFHRYSTDARWIVPHFEKMLYDNGQLASTYAEAYRRSGDEYYAQVVRDVLEYVLGVMTSPQGAFFSAQDAETSHREGLSYLWLADEVRSALRDGGRDDLSDFALRIYGFTEGTNFLDPHHPEDGRKNVVHLLERPEALAKRLGLTLAEFHQRRADVDAILLAVRNRREQPLTDDKILTSWNGLMIAGFADGGRALGEPRFRAAAERAAEYVLAHMRTPEDGSLVRTSRDGRARIAAFAEDYAAMIRGLIALHRATSGTGSSSHLDAARELAAQIKLRFWDDAGGGYFDTQAAQSDLFVRAKSTYDGALPSANSLMANNLLDLYELTGRQEYLDDARATLASMSTVLHERPTGPILAALALHRVLTPAPPAEPAPAPAARPSFLKGADPVEIRTSQRQLRLAPGSSATLEVTLQIAAGHHVNANKPGIDFLVPLEITLVDGEGIRLHVDYPPGQAYSGPEGSMLVYGGSVRIPLRLERVDGLRGNPRLMIRYQVCTDRVCLAPETRRLPVGIVSEE